MPTTRPRAGGAKPEPLFQPPPGAQPLAARMRPRTLDEYVGQAPLARLLADGIGADMIALSAVSSGVAEVRGSVAQAQDRLAMNGKRTVLFIAEDHILNK